MLAREIEREGIPVAHITAMTMLAKQIGSNRVVTGTKIAHPCGDPTASELTDLSIRRKIVECALTALTTEVSGPTIFVPDMQYTLG